MKSRVVFLVASLRGGGAERVFVLMANELAARGHAVTLLTWNGEGPNARLLGPSVELVDLALPLRGEGYGRSATLRSILRTARLLRQLRPDAVFSAPEFFNLVTTLSLMIGASRARFFPSFHAARALPGGGLGSALAVKLSALVARRATKAIAVSAGVGRELVERGFPEAKVVVIHNPLPGQAIPKSADHPWRAAIAAMGEGPVVATAGRLVPVKDHRTLIRAFALLRAKRPARLVIFGEGPLEGELRAFAGECGVGADVLFPGYVNDPAACYAVADLFVLSSLTEGFGNVLVEAMEAGVSVVSTDAPYGPREILEDGRLGPLVPVGDAAALAAAMEATLDRPIPPALLREKAAEFGTARIGNLYEALLR
ncbi:MAG: glycosyltransferase [Mesorhizobium amorphae]|nr:MAG: glycosyltransferase [Mesorhizobium amorphae]